MKKLYGFYSAEAAIICGSSIYQKADGIEVEVTGVEDNPEGFGYHWADKQYVGEVIKYLRHEQSGDLLLLADPWEDTDAIYMYSGEDT